MEYSNPEIPEGINTSREHPLKEYAVLVGGILLVIAAVAAALTLLADQIALRIPFAYEEALTSEYEEGLPTENQVSQQLQALADLLVEDMELPEGAVITVHYVNDDTVNAYATLGGHVIIYRGLLEKLPHENALAMVLAHEIAHVKHRHPVRSLGRGVVLGLSLAVLTGVSGNQLVGEVLGDAGLLTLLKFSRDQERAADRTGIGAVADLYGHVSGSLDLYRALLESKGENVLKIPAFLSTHPLTQDRIEDLDKFSDENGWQMEEPTLPLGEDLTNLR